MRPVSTRPAPVLLLPDKPLVVGRVMDKVVLGGSYVARVLHHPPSPGSRLQPGQPGHMWSGPVFKFARAVASMPLTRYDTPEVRAGRVHELDTLAELQHRTGAASGLAINTPERQALRERIIGDIYGQGAARQDRQAWVVIAIPSGGKSTVSDPIAKEHGALNIDPDGPMFFLPEFQQTHSGLFNASEAEYIKERLQDRCIERGDNVILNHTAPSGAESLMGILTDLRDHGYHTHLVYLNLPVEKAFERSLERWHTQGRFTEPIGLELRGASTRRAYEDLKGSPLIDDSVEYSTDVPRGQSPRVIERS